MLRTKIIKINPKKIDLEKIKTAAKILINGGLVAFPTDTVYGLGANYHDKRAVERIYTIKGRSKDKPLPIQIASPQKLKEFNVEITDDAKILIDKFWPGGLTLILETKNKEKLGFRIPDNSIVKSLLEEVKVPLYVPSANFSGDIAPRSAHNVIVSFDGIIEAIIDGSRCPGGIESTVLDMTTQPYRILREGIIKKEELQSCFTENDKFVKVKNILFVCTGNSCRSVMAKGLLLKETSSRADLNIESAGTATLSGLSPTRETIEVMTREGIDVSGEKSRHISTSKINKAYLILVMKLEHKKYILKRYPQSKGKVYLLKEYKNYMDIKDLNITDPIGQPMSIYEEVFAQIKTEIERIKNLI